MKSLAVGVMLMVVPLVASATDWYLFDWQNQKCVSSTQASAKSGVSMTPLSWWNFFRKHPAFGDPSYKVFHHKDGRAVLLFWDKGKHNMLFFSDEAMCQNYRRNLIPPGQGLNQLK